eukprot:CAMPEP_0173412380 /NCGR_PEP_ID=MMETSP1356-20130122/79346_1 /TAXON_ID=77927 ORGANISM="Hemiselmis virescens, Strain PCC157" /NCGR_SAMPLE_ID=MMETSP1356 /ASSEMBLY_ACC=CAM_ASM_000847 /LENGTH=80 /DNA_ID=CAMNT_0014374263 /DNA_START=72 /DNA_END=311 /DNA_ORIENTATION=+
MDSLSNLATPAYSPSHQGLPVNSLRGDMMEVHERLDSQAEALRAIMERSKSNRDMLQALLPETSSHRSTRPGSASRGASA